MLKFHVIEGGGRGGGGGGGQQAYCFTMTCVQPPLGKGCALLCVWTLIKGIP